MKPMLAAATDGYDLTYPLITSPKFDGIRCLIIDGVAVSRSLKPIPNKHVQKLFGRKTFNGLDGELIVGPSTAKDVFQRTTSGVMAIKGNPDVRFYVFDDYRINAPFEDRLVKVGGRTHQVNRLELVPHQIVKNELELFACEQLCINHGYEGMMLRSPDGQYKYGRSTLKQSWLLKLKRFVDAEAKIIGITQLMHNTNEAKTNELGHKERSTKKAGKVGLNQLGTIQVRDTETDVEFGIGTGFTQTQRKKLWKNQDALIGQLVKYKSQPVGVKDKPRFPVFLGFRNQRDL